jgi:hypothetical protein
MIASLLMNPKIPGVSLALFGFAFVAAWGVDIPAPPAMDALIRQVIARDDSNQKALQSMQYNESLNSDRLDGQGKVMQHQEVRMIVRPGSAQEIEVLSVKGNDLPTDPDQAALQAQGKQAQKNQVRFALKDMAGRFRITYAGSDTIRGQPVYIVAFAPKSDQPYRDQTEKVLNHLHGRMWISPRDYSVLKTEATLAEPVQVAWVFASVTSLDFHYELDGGPGEMGPALIQTMVRVDAPFITIRQRMIVDMTQFQSRAKSIASGK